MPFASQLFTFLWLAAAFSQAPATPPPPPPKPAPAPAAESATGVTLVQDLLASLAKYEQDGKPAKRKLGFEIPEKALNDYLAYSLRKTPRPGIGAMTVSLLPQNQISSEVEIDFSALQQWNPQIFPEALRSILSGKRTIKTNLEFESHDGTCNVSLKDAVGPDGKAIVNKIMLTLFEILGSRQPEAYDTTKPIPLPYGLKRIWTQRLLFCGET